MTSRNVYAVTCVRDNRVTTVYYACDHADVARVVAERDPRISRVYSVLLDRDLVDYEADVNV